jgi:predicted unusual protein kinase regulating ubiquinone biosynthesis (AarF/ABC1/UbiB family)
MTMIWSCAQRLVHILSVLLRHAAARYARPVVLRFGCLSRRPRPTELSGPERLRRMFEELGGSFIKLGQMLAMQPDILPLEYCDALYDLLDHVKPVPADEIAQVIRDDTGSEPTKLFDSFDPVPLASGSIGQVHVAWKGGRKLAVKVQRPDARSNFDRDVKLMTLTVWLVRTLRVRPLSFLIDPLSEFASWTRDELDFRREAAYMRQLRRNAEVSESQYIPYVLAEHTTRRVLVVEFLDGVTLMDHLRALRRKDEAHEARLSEIGFDADQLARNVIDNCLSNVFLIGVFHADIHPANLMLLPGNVVGYIDFGITGVISRYSRHNLLAMTLAYARKDIDALCSRFFAVSSFDETSDPHLFHEGVKRLAEGWYTHDPRDPRLNTTTTQVMLDMLKLSREARIWPQRDIIKYIRSAIALDGLVHRFAPGFDFGQHLGTACRRHLTSHARRMLVSHETLVDCTDAVVDLFRDGLFRLSAALDVVTERPGRAPGAVAVPAPGSPRECGSARPCDDGPRWLLAASALLLLMRTLGPNRAVLNVATALTIAAMVAAWLLVPWWAVVVPTAWRRTGG